MRREKIIVNDREYVMDIYLEQRKDCTASIGKKGVNVRLPITLSREEMFKEVIRIKRWAIEELKKKPIEVKEKGSKTYNDGDFLRLAGEEYVIRLSSAEKQGSSAKAEGKHFYFSLANSLSEEEKNQHVSVLLSRLIAQKKKPYITEKVKKLNQQHFNFEIRKIFLKYNTSNWGSCSKQNNINISTRLLFAPEEVINYVCIHELAHVGEKNHSPAFWSLVEKAMPDYQEKKKWLKENSKQCWF